MRKQYLRVFSFVTAVNLLVVSHIETSGNLREGWQQNYVKGFQWWDVILFLILFLVLYGGAMVFVEKVFPKVQCAFHNYGISAVGGNYNSTRDSRIAGVNGAYFGVRFSFFLQSGSFSFWYSILGRQ